MTTPASVRLQRLPQDLKDRAQWCVAGADKSPFYMTAAGPVHASVTDPRTWMTFEAACAAADELGAAHVGYVLAEADDFCCIDLDVKDYRNEPDVRKHTNQGHVTLFWQIVQMVNSYTELSRSGIGLHIWVRGNIGAGARRDHVEVYSQHRFIICTGQPIQGFDKPMEDRQQLIETLVSDMRLGQQGAANIELVELEEEEGDEAVYEKAHTAANHEKFDALCAGQWVDMGFPSQSEADLALMSIFTFYSRSNEQCRRLFRCTQLGKREKATKNDRYLNYTLRIIRARQAREDAEAARIEAAAQGLVQSLHAQQGAATQQERAAAAAYVAQLQGLEPAANAAPSASSHVLAPTPEAPDHGGIDWPPGLTGHIAGFIYRSAPRPVKEVAIVAALGLLAGICGKAYNIPQSGLNLYIILVARSAVGKEAMHSGIGRLLARLRHGMPTASNFVDFSEFVSGPALVKRCADNPSFVNVAGEWGRKLKKIAQDSDRDGPAQSLRTAMTNLYQKSGPTSVVGGLQYSSKENNVQSVNGVAYSMIGETTPGTFYDALTESMMEDGFLSRFTIVEYTGERPPANPDPAQWPEEPLAEALGNLMLQAGKLNNAHTPQPVTRTSEAGEIMDAFDRECDAQINSTTDESWRQMWNRAHLKMSRIAALLAAADSPYAPIIAAQHVAWALDLVRRDITIMQRRIESGDVGTGDSSRERKVLALIKEYLMNDVPQGYGVPVTMRLAGVVPRKYLQIRTSRVSSFTIARQGSAKALDDTVRSLMDSGYLVEVERAKATEAYGFQGKCYRVVNLPGQVNVQ